MSNGLGNKGTVELASNTNTLFAGSGGFAGTGVYFSTNYGENWNPTALNWGIVSALAVNGNNIFAGISQHVTLGIYKSSDNGLSWNYSGFQSEGITALAAIGNNVFVATSSNWIYLSTNNGIDWSQISQGGAKVLVINGAYIFRGSSGVYISTNNGTNWVYLGPSSQSVYSLAVSGSNIFAGIVSMSSPYGVYKSSNNGTNWSQTSLNNRNVYALAVNGTNVFAGTSQYGIYFSNNNGTSWVQRNEGLTNLNISALHIFNNFVFAATSSGVFRRPLTEFTGINPVSNEIPNQFSLEQNYPNPFNPNTKIRFQLPKTAFVNMVVYNVLGKELTTLVNEHLNPGTYETEWDASNYPSGVYFYRIKTPEKVEVRKMVFTK